MQDDGQQHGDSPTSHAAKRTIDHDDDGAERKRLHGDDSNVSFPHGDVVPQTPVSEAGYEVLDDLPFEGMMSPSKAARHGDPGGVKLLGHLNQIEHLDIEPEIPYEDQDLDTMMQHDLNLKEDPEEPLSNLSSNLKELSFPTVLKSLNSVMRS